MIFSTPLISGRLLKRYKRFLADVQLADGSVVVAHCSNTGGMLGCQEEGSEVWLHYAPSPKRKLDYSWELATDQGELVGIYSARANNLVEEAWQNGLLKAFAEYDSCRREVKVGDSRLDFVFENKAGESCFVEVKSVTASTEPNIALFPDAKTQRGVKHLRELMSLKAEGQRVAMIFCVQRNDTHKLRAAPEFDALYADTLAEALGSGVELYAYGCELSPQHIRIDREIELT